MLFGGALGGLEGMVINSGLWFTISQHVILTMAHILQLSFPTSRTGRPLGLWAQTAERFGWFSCCFLSMDSCYLYSCSKNCPLTWLAIAKTSWPVPAGRRRWVFDQLHGESQRAHTHTEEYSECRPDKYVRRNDIVPACMMS